MKRFSKMLSRRRLGRSGDGDDADVESVPISVRLGPPLEPPSDFHQLSPRRGLGYGPGDGAWSSGAVTPTGVGPGSDNGILGGGAMEAASGPGTGPGTGATTASDWRLRKMMPRTGGYRIVADGSDGVDDDANGSSNAASLGKPCVACAIINFPRLLDWQPGDARPWIPLSHVLKKSTGNADPNADNCPYCVFFQAMVGATASMGAGLDKSTPYMRIRLAFEKLGGGEKHELGRSVLVEVSTGSRVLPWGYIIKAEEGDEMDMSRYLEGTVTTQSKEDANGRQDPVEEDAPKQEGQEEHESGKETKQEQKPGTPSPTSVPSIVISSNSSVNDKTTASIRGRRISPLLDPQLPKMWLDFCNNHHADSPCTKSNLRDTLPIKGLQLIDCEEKRLVAADDLDLLTTDYVTLSCVWGDHADDNLTEDGEGNHLLGNLPPSHPRCSIPFAISWIPVLMDRPLLSFRTG